MDIQTLNISNIQFSSIDLDWIFVGSSVWIDVLTINFSGCLTSSPWQSDFCSNSVLNLMLVYEESLLKASKKFYSPISFLNSETILVIVLKRLYIFWFWLLHWEGFLVPMKWDICLKTLLALNKNIITFFAAWRREWPCCREQRQHISIFLNCSKDHQDNFHHFIWEFSSQS